MDRISQHISVKPFEWEHWSHLWELRRHQLAENGIEVSFDGPPPQPEEAGQDNPEWDYHRIGQVYLQGVGGFWIAWWDDVAVGHVGGQDLGGIVELRRMYVRAEYRGRGIGTRLVRALITHSIAQGVKAIELWTAPDGPGRFLYAQTGFRETAGLGEGFAGAASLTGRSPAEHEIRMRLDLSNLKNRIT